MSGGWEFDKSPVQNELRCRGVMSACDARTQGASIAALFTRLRTPQRARTARHGGSRLHSEMGSWRATEVGSPGGVPPPRVVRADETRSALAADPRSLRNPRLRG